MRPLEVWDIVELKPQYVIQYPDGVLSPNPRNNQSQMGSIIHIDENTGEAIVENGDNQTTYPLNVLRIYKGENNSNSNVNMTGGRKKRRSHKSKRSSRKTRRRRQSRRR
jgi:hypothetical protein